MTGNLNDLFPPNDLSFSISASYEWLAIDIETADGRPEGAESWMRRCWSPSESWKDETIGKRYHEMLAKKKERLALLNESPIICISLKSPDELRCLHACYKQDAKDLHGGLVEGFATMGEMLIAFANLLTARADEETVLVGHNIKAFDLPKLRWAFIRERIKLPRVLAEAGSQHVLDTMIGYTRHFSIEPKIMISLDDVLQMFGIDSHKGVLSGKQIPELYAAGEFDTIIQYALLDVIEEADLFQRMAGLTGGEKKECTT